MKKIGNFFKTIIKFFDKYLVIPVTRLVLKITSYFDKSSHKFENLLSKPSTLLFLSLAISIILFLLVDSRIITLNNSSAEVLKNQSVEVLYNEERFVVENVPESVDITLIGSKADLYLAKQSSNHSVKIDLTNIKEPGTYSVDLDYNIDLDSIEASVNPSEATLVVWLRASENRTLSYNIVNADKLDNTLEIENVELNVGQAIISGADYKVAQVASVEALVDVDKLNSKKAGKQTLEDIILKAYDAEGNIVDVEISTSEKVTAVVDITSSSREVPLNFVIKNNTMPFGKAVSSYNFSKATVVAYGSQEVLDRLAEKGIDIVFDGSKLSSNYHGTVEIPTPDGIKKLDTNRIDVNVIVTNSVSSSKYNMTLKIDALNTPSGYTAGAASSKDAEVLVKPVCAENVCKALSSADLEAYVDLSSLANLGPGTYEVPVYIKAKTSNARLATFTLSPEKVKIKLTKN